MIAKPGRGYGTTQDTVVEYRKLRGFEIACATRKGRLSRQNADRFRIFDQGVCVVDGMSGCPAPEVFAELAASQLSSGYAQGGQTPAGLLGSANGRLCELGASVLYARGGAMGAVCLLNDEGGCSLGVKGDVLALLMGDGRVEQLCKTCGGRFLGDGDNCAVAACELGKDRLADGCVLLCSDGFWRFATKGETLRTVRGAASLEEGAAGLVELARSSASTDDITVALCRAVASETPPRRRMS